MLQTTQFLFFKQCAYGARRCSGWHWRAPLPSDCSGSGSGGSFIIPSLTLFVQVCRFLSSIRYLLFVVHTLRHAWLLGMGRTCA